MYDLIGSPPITASDVVLSLLRSGKDPQWVVDTWETDSTPLLTSMTESRGKSSFG